MSKTVSNTNNTNKSDVRVEKLKLYSILSILLLIGIVLFVNILFDGILGKALTFDFSDTGSNSISSETKNYIDTLSPDTHIRVVGLFNRPDNVSGTPYQYIIPLLDDYVKQSDGRITVEYKDINENPGIINELDPSNSYNLASNTGNFVFEYNGKIKILSPIECYSIDLDYYNSTGVYLVTANNAEYTLTNTMNILTSGYSCKAYIVTGLKEDGNTYINKILDSLSISVEELPSSENFIIPDDCDLLILNGPNTDISEKMYVAMTDYLNRGGKMFIAVDYNIRNVGERYERLNLLVNQMNISIDPALIHENNPGYQLSGYSIDHTVVATDPFIEYSSIPYLHATYSRPISAHIDPGSNLKLYPVLQTSTNAMLIEYDDSGIVVENSADTTGQYNVAMYACGDNDRIAKMFVFGTMNFSSDDYISGYGLNDTNVDFFRSCIKELVRGKTAVSLNIMTKSIDDYSLDSTKSTTSISMGMLVVFMIVIPVILVGMAVIVYAKRKNL